MKSKSKNLKCKPWEIPCMEGHIKCFNFTDICLYKLSTKNHMIPCRNGGHLDNCKKFECNTMFKCPNSYCVPWTYVCDGKWDCPYGEDEERNKVCTGEIVCEGMFKCNYKLHKCISLGNVCDNKLDCLLHDDEMFCELSLFKCPVSCSCLIYAITCFSLPNNITELDLISSLLSLSVFKSIIISFHIFDHKLQNIQFIQLNVNNITSICPLVFLKDIVLLNIAENYIAVLKEKCFSISTFLKSLNLSFNHVTHIETYSFYNLHHIKYIDLSNNPFVNLPSKCFSNLMVLRVLSLENIELRIIETNSLHSTNIKIIRNLDYKVNCVISDNYFCTSYPPWYISCTSILPSSIKVIYICISTLTIVLNILSILLQFLRSQMRKTNFQINVFLLNFTDILCGTYLAIIWVSDTLLMDIYLINEELWKSHPLCFVALSTIVWFTIFAQLILLYLSTSRLLSVMYPIKTKIRSLKNVSIISILYRYFQFQSVWVLLSSSSSLKNKYQQLYVHLLLIHLVHQFYQRFHHGQLLYHSPFLPY